MTVRRAAAAIGVHRDTAFRWRHRLLGVVRTGEDYALGLVVSVEESFAYPGRKLLLALDDNGRAAGVAIGAGHATAHTVAALLGRRTPASALLLTSSGEYGAVARFARSNGRAWAKRLSFDPRFDGRIERPRWYAFRLRRWLVRFRGVADHYLDNYLAWFRLEDGQLWRGLLRRERMTRLRAPAARLG